MPPAGLRDDPPPATGVQHRARQIITRYRDMKAEKAPLMPMYELLAKYVFMRNTHFTTTSVPGNILPAGVFDDTAASMNTMLAASLIGAMWQNGGKSFRIVAPFGLQQEIEQASGGQQGDTDEIVKYYEWASKQMARFMDNPKSGFKTALEEYMMDQGAFALSGIGSEEQEDNDEVPLLYRAVDVKHTCIDEGPDGFVNTIYTERTYTLRQLVTKYGYDALSADYQAKFNAGNTKMRVQVLHAVEPRLERDPYGFGTKNMPIASIHIDLKTEKILKESGYAEMPVAVCRFWKTLNQKYGWCPAMNAMSAILEANALGEAWTMAVEKTLDPALLVLDDSGMGNGIIDTSPGGVTVVAVSGRLGNHKPIEPIFVVGDLKWTAERRTELHELISNHFFKDRLDLDSEQRMQNPEVAIRDQRQGQTMNPVYTRQMAETFSPTLERTFSVLQRRDLLGVIRGSAAEHRLLAKGKIPVYIPDAVARRLQNGEEVYEIEYVSPATRVMQADELQGITQTLQLAVEAGGVNPEALDNINMDVTLKKVQQLTGAPTEMINSMEAVKNLRTARAQQQQAEAQAQQNLAHSQTAKNVAQAVSAVAPPDKNKQQSAAA